MIQLFNDNCEVVLQSLVDKGIKAELIVIDPPYDIKNTNAGTSNLLCGSIQNSLTQIYGQWNNRGSK
jgi:DNA modification methylase